MMKSILRNGAIVLTALLITLTACHRKDSTDSNPALTSSDDQGGYASDGAKLEQNSSDVISIADAAGATGDASNLRTTSTYPTVTRDTVSNPHMLTIDFGPTGVTGWDLKTRKGQIIVTYSGHYKDSGSIHTITTSNYYVNDKKVIAHKAVTNEGMNMSGQVWYNVSVNDSIILGTDSVISWSGSRTRTWLAGYSTPERSDDVYLVGGTTTLHRANGHIFTYAISTSDPLKVALDCPVIEAGTVTISSSSFTGGDRTLNYGYGGGGCDYLAQLTVGTHTYTIHLY